MWCRTKNLFLQFSKDQRGTQLIEFAIVLPVLILLFAGVTELGRLFYTYTSLAKATRSGARYLSTVQNVNTSTSLAKNIVRCGNSGGCGGQGQPAPIVPGLELNHIVVTPPPAGSAAVKYVTVEISGYTYQPVVFDLGALTGSDIRIALAPSTTMRHMP